MNKIRVNMAVEPNDIQTLHCSQYDTEERKFSVDLHENGVGVSPSSISNQLVYKSFKGGTEQILPTNTSTPSTSPIIADIQYKDGLREDEEFLYRESPSDVDGYAKIKEIRGNTLVWNQIVQNGNFADSSVWTGNNASVSIANNKCNVTVTVVHSSCALRNAVVNGISGHKYLGIMTVTSPKATACAFYLSGGSSNAVSVSANVRTVVYGIVTPTSNTGGSYFYINRNTQLSVNDTVVVENVMFIDLTKMGLDTLTASEFTSLFPLSYYAYDSGSLLSFNGSGIKTVGKNRAYLEQGTLNFNSDGSEAPSTSRVRTNFIPVEEATDYVASSESNGWIIKNGCCYDANFNYLGYNIYPKPNNGRFSSTLQSTEWKPNLKYVRFIYGNSSNTNCTPSDYWYQFELGSTATDYVPYSTNTLSLPISTYFPDGMLSAGSVYDELTPTSYVKRVGIVDLGNLDWTYANQAGHLRFYTPKINAKVTTGGQSVANAVCTVYNNISEGKVYGNVEVGICITSEGRIMVCDPSYTDASTFKSAMSGVYLNYELATPLENYGVVDLGSLDWAYQSSVNAFTSSVSDRYIFDSSITIPKILCSKYTTSARYTSLSQLSSYADMTVTAQTTNTAIAIKNSSYTDANTFKNAMSGVYLLYEKSNPQGLKTASIVTNYGEMPLYNDNGELKADCISDVSQNSGFQIAKVKLKDENGEIYSNPFQIHTERSPQ